MTIKKESADRPELSLRERVAALEKRESMTIELGARLQRRIREADEAILAAGKLTDAISVRLEAHEKDLIEQMKLNNQLMRDLIEMKEANAQPLVMAAPSVGMSPEEHERDLGRQLDRLEEWRDLHVLSFRSLDRAHDALQREFEALRKAVLG